MAGRSHVFQQKNWHSLLTQIDYIKQNRPNQAKSHGNSSRQGNTHTPEFAGLFIKYDDFK